MPALRFLGIYESLTSCLLDRMDSPNVVDSDAQLQRSLPRLTPNLNIKATAAVASLRDRFNVGHK